MIWKWGWLGLRGDKNDVHGTPVEPDGRQNDERIPSVRLSKDAVMFHGICEGMDDEVYYIRFDADWLEMLDRDLITSKKEEGERISFSSSIYDIQVYPYII